MDLFKLLNNPMQQMMGRELGNVFERLSSKKQQNPMSQMQYQPQEYQSPFMQQGMNQAPQDMQQLPEQDEWEMMRDQMLQRQGADEDADLAQQEAEYKAEMLADGELEQAVAPILEGFPEDQRAEWMDAFLDSLSGGDEEFLETVREEVGPENQKEWDEIVAKFMEPEPASVSEYLSKHMGGGDDDDEEIADEELTLGAGNPSDPDGEEIVDENGIPADGVPFDKMKAAEQNAVSKQMREESTKAQSLVRAHRTLQQMKDIVKEHPNMAQDMAAVFAEPNEDPGLVKQLMQKYFANKKELAAYQKFTKLSSELVLDAGGALGGKNFTDAKMRLIQRSKPSGRMTDDALNYVIDHMMYDWEPAQAYANAIEKGRVGRYQPRMEMEAYRGKRKKTQKSYEDMSDEELEAAVAEAENG